MELSRNADRNRSRVHLLLFVEDRDVDGIYQATTQQRLVDDARQHDCVAVYLMVDCETLHGSSQYSTKAS